MYRKVKGQTQAIQWTEKKKHKHRQHNGQERQSTNTGHTMNKKDKGQAQAIQYTKKHKGKAQVIQCAKKVKDKHRTYNGK